MSWMLRLLWLCLLVAQVKSWTPSGELLSASGHHHTAIQCLALVPLQQHHLSPTVAAAAGGMTSGRSSMAGDRRVSTAGDRRVSSGGGRVQSAGSSSSAVPCKVWVGAADGSLSVCSDVTGSGALDPAGWRVMRMEGLTGEAARAGRRS